jgi:2-keto-4-pentenoate hydratase/2-oxohepta-3-ene-1,7-dioic acid hydratase in catechol pathway
MQVPFLQPSKIVCVGRNYAAHARELGNEVPREPLLFLKPPSAIVTDGQYIVLPPESRQVEFEGEIGVVIGHQLRRASQAEAAAAVAALVAVNDVTARDLQRSDSQWTRAKGFDTFCPVSQVGDAPSDLTAIELVTRVNGEVRQHASSAEMIFPIPFLLSYISQVMTLLPGDLVATGTPAGVGPLSPGDEVEVEICGRLRVRNPVRSEL